LIVIIGLVGCATFGYLLSLFGGAYSKAAALVASSQTANAEITGIFAKSRGNVKTVHYTFEVNGVKFKGESNSTGDDDNRGAIMIHYLPSDPTNSAIDPKSRLVNAKVGLGAAFGQIILLFVTLGVLGARRFRRPS
jgi:hypothetical protein